MKLSDKVKVYVAVYDSSVGIEFSKRNFMLYTVAKSLGLKHFFGSTSYSLVHPRRKASLVDLAV